MYHKDDSRKKPSMVRLVPDREQAANIIFYMKMRDVTQEEISVTVGVTRQMVQRVIYGLSTSHRVQTAIAASLGFTSWTALTSNRKGVAA